VKFSRCVIKFDLGLNMWITFITLFLVVSEIRGGVFKVNAKKEKRTAAKTKAARLLTYVRRPKKSILLKKGLE